MTGSFKINVRKIGTGLPTYFVAELSANHRQKLDQAIDALKAAKEAGADAVKLQTYTPDTMTIPVNNEYFRISSGTIWDGKLLYDLYKEAYTPWEWHEELKRVAEELNIDLFSTAFDESAVDFLEKMDVSVHKVASFELIDVPLIEKMARTGKPLIISTGMSTVSEIEDAVNTARDAGASQILLLKCTSAYPSPPEEMNLRTIPHLSEMFHLPVGLSDHTLGTAVPIAAVSLGACVVEKHFTLSRDLPSPDSSFSLEPQEFKTMVEAVKTAEKALGNVHYGVNEREESSKVFRRSLFVVENVRKGEVFTNKNVRSIRPGHGLPPKYLEDILGKCAGRDIPKGTPVNWNLLG